jgi:hypothetical protein
MSDELHRPTLMWRRTGFEPDVEPGPEWYARASHHGIGVLLLLVAAAAVYLLFPAPRPPDAAVLEQGVVAPQDVIAEFPFNIPKAPDRLLREQEEAAAGVPPVYGQVPAAGDSVLQGVNRFFAGVDSIVSHVPREDRRAAVLAFMAANRISPTATSVERLLDTRDREALHRSIPAAVHDLFPRGVAPLTLNPGVAAVRVRQPDGKERLVPRDSLLTPERFFAQAAERLPGRAGVDEAELQRLILIRYFEPSLTSDEARTEAARARARSAVDPVAARVLRGE